MIDMRGKIVCVGQNYREHIRELDNEVPDEPVIFLKPSSALIGDGDEIVLPPAIGRVDHEVELALIIGRAARNLTAESAMACVSHLAVFNDVTARDMQNAARKAGMPWSLSKGMDTFAPMSEPKEYEQDVDCHSLQLRLTVNGEVRQAGSTSDMIHSPEALLAYITRWMRLDVGDIVATGTPKGVSPLRHGDLVEASIPGVGAVRNRVRQA
jgi:2-keto-4-pentenoate hydratase/2-oxohepta-3-ene-1,7-dioic acid hydratase in catechol pathway